MKQDNSLFDDAEQATPVMAQYLATKSHHQNALLLFRMGDFYELFFEDAVQAAEVLHIALTRRGRYQGRDIPMCGVPVHAVDHYVSKLVRLGMKVVIAEQMETAEEAKKRKSLMKREVTRIITAGTLTDEKHLEDNRHHHLAAIGRSGSSYAVAWMDVSTGAFLVEECGKKNNNAITTLQASLARIEPSELILPMGWMSLPLWQSVMLEWRDVITSIADARFEKKRATRALLALLDVKQLDAIGNFSDAATCAAGAVASYVQETLCGQKSFVQPLRHDDRSLCMALDGITMRHLELFATANGERKGSLLAAVDKSVTAAGARLMASVIASPLSNKDAIEQRLQRVDWFLHHPDHLQWVRRCLKGCPDVGRALNRIILHATRPVDLGLIRDCLAVRASLVAFFMEHRAPETIANLFPHKNTLDELHHELRNALVDEPPLQLKGGGVIRQGYREHLDEVTHDCREWQRKIKELELRYSKETGIKGLTIEMNDKVGTFIKVNHASAHILKERGFVRLSAVKQHARFVSDELLNLQRQWDYAAERRETMEREVFSQLREQAVRASHDISHLAQSLSWVDVAAAVATYAQLHDGCRPQLSDSNELHIVAGRHPVVEQSPLEDGGFVPNDCHLQDDDRMWLLTGPNMAGKSTFLRQNALIILMAQAGFYVPAKEARIGLVDRLCSRVGASDDLIRGRSTFMVEMIETAAILNQATHRSFVILDEVGRGTATHDGLAIAWAVLEHLHDINGARAIIATHYHELVMCGESLPSLSVHRMTVKEWEDGIIFLREVAAGAANASYGIHAASLAGLPQSVTERAFALMTAWHEKGDVVAIAPAPPPQTPKKKNDNAAAILRALADTNPDQLTPKQAMELLYHLISLLPRNE